MMCLLSFLKEGESRAFTIATRKITDRFCFPEHYLEIGNGFPTRKNSVWELFGSVMGIKSLII